MIAAKAFGENHAASIMAKEKNSRKPTPASLLSDIQKAWRASGIDGLRHQRHRQHRHEGLLSGLLPGLGDAKPYFDRFGHLSHRMTGMAINGLLPEDIGTDFFRDAGMGIRRLPICYPRVVWKTFREERLGSDTAPRLPDRVWPLENPQNPWSHRCLWETDWGLAPGKPRSGVQHHRQVNSGR